TVVDPDMLEHGWELKGEDTGPVPGVRYLYEVYKAAVPDFTGRVTVPMLWDIERRTIVNNESSEIIRMLDEELAPGVMNLRPAALADEIDAINARVYDT